MAISGFGRGKGDEMTTGGGSRASAPQTPSSSGGGMGGLTAFIDQGSEFEGKLSFKDTVRIDGTFRGEISSENTLVVGETGEIEATIHSQTVVISGSVVGDIFADKQIMLHKSARVQGDLHTPSVVIEEGALFNGTLDMSKTSGGNAAGGGNLKAIKGGNKPEGNANANANAGGGNGNK
jgi:cytoskeletal protein CcmA (bactofilin family)